MEEVLLPRSQDFVYHVAQYLVVVIISRKETFFSVLMRINLYFLNLCRQGTYKWVLLHRVWAQGSQLRKQRTSNFTLGCEIQLFVYFQGCKIQLFKLSPPEPLTQIQNNFTELSLLILYHICTNG